MLHYFNTSVSGLVILLIISACNSSNTTPKINTQPTFNVTSVSLGRFESGEVSSSIIFNYTGPSITNWKFGFHMPRTFNTNVAENINPNLVMQICANTYGPQCAVLQYQRESFITSPDLSASYTTVIAPTTTYALNSGQTYTIYLNRSNVAGASNYTAVPQNFFIISGNTVANSTPEKAVYSLGAYDATAVNSAIASRLTRNWESSTAIESTMVNNIIPTPVDYMSNASVFKLVDNIAIHNLLANSDNTIANLIQTDLSTDWGILTTVDNVNISTGIIIQQIESPSIINSNPEGYQIIITSNNVQINVLTNTGALYALQSLRQLWNESPELSGATIIDYPRFKYRGILLDTARHFFSVNQIESFIDIAVAHKLNTFHWHISDDEAFRLGILYSLVQQQLSDSRGYGNNSSIGLMLLQGNLDKTNYNSLIYPYVDTTYAGTYSPADIFKIVKYANIRGITIIPEIDIPGHVRSLIKAYPNILVDPNDKSQYLSVQGYSDNVLPICKYNNNTDTAFTSLINSILQTSATLFNSQNTIYAIDNEISVGADEVSPDAWTNDISCDVSTWSGLSSLERSQQFLQLLSTHNSNLIISGWQQLVQNNDITLGKNIVNPKNVGHIWVWNSSNLESSGPAQVKTLVSATYPVVLDYSDQNYFDLTYTPDINEPGFYWATAFSDTYAALQSAISATQTLNLVTATQQNLILGLEATLWTENIPTYNHLIYMTLPKMAGLAEAAWSPATVTDINNQSNWQSLAMRLGCGKTGFLAYLNKRYGVIYRGYPNGISLELPQNNFCQVPPR